MYSIYLVELHTGSSRYVVASDVDEFGDAIREDFNQVGSVSRVFSGVTLPAVIQWRNGTTYQMQNQIEMCYKDLSKFLSKLDAGKDYVVGITNV